MAGNSAQSLKGTIMNGSKLVQYEIWQNDDTHLMDVWLVESDHADADAERIAYAMGGMAHRELTGIVKPD